MLARCKRTLPTGVPERDYPASLAVSQVSKENLAAAVPELIDSGRVIVGGLAHGGVQAAALTATSIVSAGQPGHGSWARSPASRCSSMAARRSGSIAVNSLDSGTKPSLSRPR